MPEKETGIIPMEKCPVITISREYGALGRTLADKLSERLGIPYYDRDFVNKTAEQSGYDVEEVKRDSEELKPSSKVLNSILNSAVSYSSSHDAIFKAQKEVVLELAKSPCIIVGRCADDSCFFFGHFKLHSGALQTTGRRETAKAVVCLP